MFGDYQTGVQLPIYGQQNWLGNIIHQTSGYNFQNGTDMQGNPLNDRLLSYMNDIREDPRKNEEEIRDLLSNIRPDMDIPEEEREGTPEALRYPLYPHQQLALEWMKRLENGPNKGGILADDMGLGKTISTLSLMVSNPADPEDRIKVRGLAADARSSKLTDIIFRQISSLDPWLWPNNGSKR